MARINNAITFGAGFNISAASPIDSRMRVQYESDLTNAATWNSSEAPLYDGLTTTVMETGDIWVLMDKTKFTDKTTGQGWVNKGKGSDIDDNSSANNKTWSAEKISTELSGKQNTLTAGANIVITNDTISAVIDAGFSVEVVQSLPASGETNTIYFVPISGGTTPDVYDEYMYINNAWEKIGSTQVDLSNYYNKTEVDTLLSGKQATLTANDNIEITNNAIKAVGYRYNTTTGAFAEGDRDIVDGATRPKPSATGVMAHAEGSNTKAIGRASHAEGNGGSATGIQSHAEGSEGNAIGTNSHVEGRQAVTNGYASHAEGAITETGGNYASVTTNPKTADSRTEAGAYAHAEGNASIAYGVGAHSEGQKTFAKGNYSHTEGYGTIALETAAHAEGSLTKVNVNANGSHVEGYNTETGGNRQSNDKTANTTSNAGAFAHAEGNATIAQGVSSHSEGRKTFATGGNSHAEGHTTIAQGTNSHAEGNTTIAQGTNSHAEGQITQALGGNSHSEGGLTIATGGNAHTEGRYTQALNAAEHAGGSYNISHQGNQQAGFVVDATNTLRSVGIGTADDARKNAFEIMANGDMYLLGVGNYDGMNLSGDTLQTVVNSKQGTLTAGENIDITNDTISAVGYSYDTTKGNLTQICQDETANVNTAQKNNVCLGENNSITGAETEASTIVGGYGNTVTGSACVVGGFGCSASGTSSVAMGYETSANGFNTAFGYKTQAAAQGAFAAGNGTSRKALIASGWGAAAFGKSSLSSGEASFAAGDNVTASAQSSQAFGNGTVASGNQAFAEGYETVASGLDSHAEGSHTEAAGSMQHVQGKYNIVDNNSTYADIIGNGTADNARSNAYTMTWAGKSWFADDVTSGGTNATPAHVLSNKQDQLTAGSGISIINNVISATGGSGSGTTYQAGENISIDASNNISALGYIYNTSDGSFATKYLNDDDAQNPYTATNTASGAGAFAEGYGTTATGIGNHAEGCQTQATGSQCAHAEGILTVASGNNSHAEGSQTTSAGGASHAEGESTITSNFAEHAEGIQNVTHSASTSTTDGGNTRHSIGIGQWGTSDRKNAVEVMANGDVYIYGIGGYLGTNTHVQDQEIDSIQMYVSGLETYLQALEQRVYNLEHPQIVE